ncbi:MAG: nicotinate-nucleotide adenylyltransferase [Pyrinomonadaceae bacterium]
MIKLGKNPSRRVAVYGGSFDPPHNGHLAIAKALVAQFELDEFVFIPAFHAPHKVRLKPTSAYDRYAMLCLITENLPNISVSKMEIEMPERPYSVETLGRLNAKRPNDAIFFVMGADSWMDIKTWREWEKVLTMSNHIVVNRPGYDILFDHVTDEVRERIVDLRQKAEMNVGGKENPRSIFITDAVEMNISATEIRKKIRNDDSTWRHDVPPEVTGYIYKYQIYTEL